MTDKAAGDTLDANELEALAAIDTPTICNALELVVPERRAVGFTTEPLVCVYPELKPIVGYARTLTIRAMQPAGQSPAEMKQQRLAYYEYVARGGPLPSISVVQDMDGPRAGFGAFWGEVNSHIHRGLGCLGLVTDGSVRDLDMNAAGFQMLAGRVGPSHAHVHITGFGGPVNVAGMYVRSGDLIHADRHGAVVIPASAARQLPEAAALLARREAVILDAAKAPGFDFARLKAAMGEAEEIH